MPAPKKVTKTDDPFAGLTAKERREEEQRLEQLRKSSEEEEPESPAQRTTRSQKPQPGLELSEYAKARLQKLVCTNKEVPPTRMCQMSTRGLEKLSMFFSNVVLEDPDESEQEIERRQTQLKPFAKERWAALRSKFFSLAKTEPSLLPCAVAGEVLPAVLRSRFEPLDTLSAGAAGMALRVYSLERQRNEILKVSQPDPWVYSSDLKLKYGPQVSEFAFQQRAAQLGLSPQAFELLKFEIDQTKVTGQVVPMEATSMEEMSMGFVQALECAKNENERLELFRRLNSLLRKQAANKVTHGDLHFGNVMVRYKLLSQSSESKPVYEPEMLLIDWARASFDVYEPVLDQISLVAWLHDTAKDLRFTKSKRLKYLETMFAGLEVDKRVRDHWNDSKYVSETLEEDLYFAVRDEYIQKIKTALATRPVKPKQTRQLKKSKVPQATREVRRSTRVRKTVK